MMKNIPSIVDAHLHFWDLSKHRYPWLEEPGVSDLRQDYLPDHWRRDAGDLPVRGIVHVQAELDHALDPVIETRWLESIVAVGDAKPSMVCVGYADLTKPDLSDVLARHLCHPTFRGIRQEAWYDPQSTRADVPKQNLLSDPAWTNGLRSLRDHGLSFDLLIWEHQLEQACEVFRAIPDLPVILEHTGLPRANDAAELSRWRGGMRRFATEVPNSVLKISAMNFIAAPWSPRVVGPLVRESIEIFGPHRCMFGSNFPVERRTLSYGELWRAYQEMVSGYSDVEQRALFADTASRVYRLPLA